MDVRRPHLAWYACKWRGILTGTQHGNMVGSWQVASLVLLFFYWYFSCRLLVMMSSLLMMSSLSTCQDTLELPHSKYISSSLAFQQLDNSSRFYLSCQNISSNNDRFLCINIWPLDIYCVYNRETLWCSYDSVCVSVCVCWCGCFWHLLSLARMATVSSVTALPSLSHTHTHRHTRVQTCTRSVLVIHRWTSDTWASHWDQKDTLQSVVCHWLLFSVCFFENYINL